MVLTDYKLFVVSLVFLNLWFLLNIFRRILSTTGYIEVKQRAGCLSYILDKFGYHSQLARTLTHSTVVPWDPSPTSITLFTSDKCVKLFCKHFLTGDKSKETSTVEGRLKQCLSKITYDAVVKDKLIVIVVFIALVKVKHYVINKCLFISILHKVGSRYILY